MGMRFSKGVRRRSQIYAEVEDPIPPPMGCFIERPIEIEVIKRRTELGEKLLAENMATVRQMCGRSIEAAREVPHFSFNIKLNLDDRMREMYEAPVTKGELTARMAENTDEIEKVLHIRNKLLSVTNTNYFHEEFAAEVPANISAARNAIY